MTQRVLPRPFLPLAVASVSLALLVPSLAAKAAEPPGAPPSGSSSAASTAVAPSGATSAAGSAPAGRTAVCRDAPERAFADVPTGSTHRANIDCIAAYGIAVGVGGGNYDPSGTVNRGQMASFLVNFLEVAQATQHPDPLTSRFTDVAGTTHAGNIRTAASLGVTSGRTASTYAPAERVTRAQMATFVAQALRSAGATLPAGADRFRDDTGSVHERNINALAAAGVVNGVAADRYDPTGYVTRAQMATFLANAAGLLADQGHWKAPALAAGPTAMLVARADAATDVIEVRWDQPVQESGIASGFEVVDQGRKQLIARGTSLTRSSTDRTRVVLDSQLVEGVTYWLRVAHGAKLGADGKRAPEHSLPFVFAASGGGGTGGGGSGGGAAPSVMRIETAPATSRLIVTFDQPVTCPSSGKAAWVFTNNSIAESPPQASGSPNSVTQSGAPSTTCELVYSAAGVENGDFGTMAYTQPAAAADQVRSSTGVPLASFNGIRVTDTVAPTMVSVSAFAGSSGVTVRFSEPIACATYSVSQFTVTVGGVPVAVEPAGCGAPSSPDRIGFTISPWPADGQEVVVTLKPDQTLSDQSLDNRVVAGSVAITAR